MEEHELTRMLLYMLPLFWPRSTLTLMIQESDACRLYMGREVIDTERLWWEARRGFGRAPPPNTATEHTSVRQSEEEPEGEERESGEDTAEEQGDDEEDEDEEEEENASDTLLHELWKDCRENETVTRDECF